MGRPEGDLPLEFLKGGHRRATYRARFGDQRVIIKISFHPLGRFKLARERRRIAALLRRGLPAPGIVGEGWTSAGGFALVFEELAGAVSFADAWLAASDAPARGRPD